jgi:CheY-like chemotaxis protein
MKVLIADDCADTTQSLSELLQIYGYDVRCACDGVEALTIARKFRPSAAIIDIGMPRVDGYQAALELRAMSPSLALIAITGWAKTSAREQEQRRFDHYLLKPTPIEDLLALLESSARREASLRRKTLSYRAKAGQPRAKPKASDQERQRSMGSPQAAGELGLRRRRVAAKAP